MEAPKDSDTAAPSGEPFVRVPLSSRKGLKVSALVDAKDLHLVTPFKWHRNKDGYAVRTVDGKKGIKQPMARLIMGLEKGDGLEVDHMSRDKLDNRRANLRVVTHKQNGQNRLWRDGSSPYRGVSFRKDKIKNPWASYAYVEDEQRHIGVHSTDLEAARLSESCRRTHMTHYVPDHTLDPVPACQCKECR